MVVGKFFLTAAILERLNPAKRITCHFIFRCSCLIPFTLMNTCSYMLYKANPYTTGKLKINNTKGSNNDFNVSKLKNSPGEIKRQEIALMKITTPHTANNTSKNRFADKCFLSIEAIAYLQVLTQAFHRAANRTNTAFQKRNKKWAYLSMFR